MALLTNESARTRYSQLSGERDTYLHRARDGAKLTLPYLIPPTETATGTRLPTPYQAIGARGVNNMASKVLLALMPPNSPFFTQNVPDHVIDDLQQEAIESGVEDPKVLENLKTQVDSAMGKIERAVLDKLENMAARVQVFEAIKHLIVGGNVLLYIPPNNKIRVYHLDSYVIVRDPAGQPVEMVLKDHVHPYTLEDDVLEALRREEPEKFDPENIDGNTTVELYTHVLRKEEEWWARSEVNGIPLDATESTFPADASPFIPLRWTPMDGENYGRSFVEEHLGDLKSLEGLMQSIVEGSAIASKVIFLVNPNGTTKAKSLSEAPNGGFVIGNPAEVQALQVQKQADMAVAQQTAAQIEGRLGMAFLLNTSIQRSGERVTAEEIRFMAGELEDVLGGVYSTLSQDFQRPLVQYLIHSMSENGELPQLPVKMQTTITTGLEALGRGHDLNKLKLFIDAVAQFGDPAMARLNMDNVLTRIATALGMDTEGLVKSEQQMAAEQQQQQMLQMAEKLGPQGIQAMTKMAQDAVQNGQAGPPQQQPPQQQQ